ncbi:MAG: macro domain-containing protein, partial [Candidatus Zixiibacteriota bacterium]
MSDSITINSRTLRVFVDDITMLDVDAFVFYARPELTLGAGFGTAISVRGGPSIQEELNGKGPLGVTEVITTAAGDLKADFIIHAVGPAFMEEGTEGKLRTTVL